MLKGTSALLSSWGRMGACGYADRTPLHVTYRGDHTEETIQRRAQARPRALPTETKVESGTLNAKVEPLFSQVTWNTEKWANLGRGGVDEGEAGEGVGLARQVEVRDDDAREALLDGVHLWFRVSGLGLRVSNSGSARLPVRAEPEKEGERERRGRGRGREREPAIERERERGGG